MPLISERSWTCKLITTIFQQMAVGCLFLTKSVDFLNFLTDGSKASGGRGAVYLSTQRCDIV